MVSRFSPPLLYLTDDDDDDNNETEQNISYGTSILSMNNDNLPRKKRKITDTSVRINPSIVNWSKRQRNDHYHHQPTIHNSIHYEPEPTVINPDEYNLGNHQSHSFHAFDWTSELRTPSRIYSNPIQTTPSSRVSLIPPPNVMNVVKHHLDQSDTFPLSHHNDRYIQYPQRKPINIPINAATPPPPLPLPLPTHTSSLVRPQAQRIQSGKTLRSPYTHSTPPPPIPVHHPLRQVFSPPSYRSPSPASIATPISTPEIRRQALNGTGILSAFYDSKCYRCNICKFKSVTSSTLLQHLFTHIFFCPQCSFYSYSHHNLYQHIFEKHNINHNKDNIDPKNLDLIYITRCTDGTFALCMDSSSPPPPPPLLPTATKIDEKILETSKTNTKPKPPRKKRPPKPKKVQDNDIVILSEKRDINPQSSSSSVIPKRPIFKEKQTNTFVLMKHRRCYSTRHPTCLHSLSLEYNICREHTIRHMCHTQGVLKRRKIKPKFDRLILIDEVAKCLKTVVNEIVDIEEKKLVSSEPVYPLPNDILDLIFPNDDLNTITHSLKLNNIYEKSLEETKQNQSESLVRTSNQYMFILSSSGINKNEQTIFASLHTSVTNEDSIFTETKLNKLPISYDNTHRFLKGNLNILPRSTNSKTDIPSKDSILDKNNNSVTSLNPSLSPTPSVIVID